MYQIVCRLGLRPRPHWGAYSTPQTPSWFRGWGLGEREEGREGGGGKGKGGEGVPECPNPELESLVYTVTLKPGLGGHSRSSKVMPFDPAVTHDFLLALDIA